MDECQYVLVRGFASLLNRVSQFNEAVSSSNFNSLSVDTTSGMESAAPTQGDDLSTTLKLVVLTLALLLVVIHFFNTGRKKDITSSASLWQSNVKERSLDNDRKDGGGHSPAF